MSKKKETRSIGANLKITENDDIFLKKISTLQGDKKFMRGKIAYQLFTIGMQEVKKQLNEELNANENRVFFNSKELTHNNEFISSMIKIKSLLETHGLTLEVKSTQKEQKNENE